MNPYLADIDLLPINVAVYRKKGHDFMFIAFNKMAEKTENISPLDLIGKTLTEVFPGVENFGLLDVLLRVEETGNSEIFETEFYKDDRISGWRQNEVVKLDDGVVAAFYSDKNTEKELEEKGLQLTKLLNESEQELQHQRNVFQMVMENSESISVQGYNENHEVIYWNKASQTIYGYSKDEALGKKLEDLIIPTDMRQGVKSAIDNWITNAVPVPSTELTLIDKNGRETNVFSQHVMIYTKEHKHEMYCLDIDLHQIKKLQQELAQEKKFLDAIFDIIPDLVWLKDKNGVYLKCNHMFEKLYGATESEIVNKTDFDFVNDALANFFRKNDFLAIEADRPTKNEEFLSFADDSYHGMFETIKTPMKDKDGNVTGVLGIARDITDRKKREEELEVFANYDTLTGLTNRTVFMDRLSQLLYTRDNSIHYHGVLFIDLDRFKEINDTMGHSTGDKVLIMVAKRLESITRKGDTLSRLGGDEFTILLTDLKNPIEAGVVANKVLQSLREPFVIEKRKYYITSSIGISLYPDDSKSPERLLQFADSAMYKAKDRGKNRYEYYTKELSLKAIEKIYIVDSLRNAIKYKEFELYYQVQTDALDKKTVGAEALIRWNQPQKGLQIPAKFIPLAESSGLILEMGKWVILQAMKDIAEWKNNSLDIEKVSINLSPKQLDDEQLIPSIIKSLKESGAKPEWIEFEVTETYTMDNPETSILELNKLVNLGFTLSVDDFGTGYSSLSYLRRLPISKLKIDKSFVDVIEYDDDDKAIVNAVILIAKSMQLDVIAEGVENLAQQELLLEYGCNLAQGYLYSKPLPKKEFEEFIKLSSTS